MPSKRGSLKKPLTTSNEQGSRCSRSIQNDHLRKPHLDTKKTREKSTSTCHAKTDYDDPPNGSNAWTEERWLDTPRTTRRGTSPSSPIYTPRKNTIMTMRTTPPGPYLHGLYPLSEGAALPTLHSAENLTSSLYTIGVSWRRSTGTGPWMSSASRSAARLTFSNKSSKRPAWSGGSARGGSKWLKP